MAINKYRLEQARKDAEQAIKVHDDALRKLRRPDGQPYYSDEVMREQATAARQALTAKFDAIAADVDKIADETRAALEAAEANKYTWLNDDELARAALLMPFVAADIEAMGADGLRALEYKTRAGGGHLDRVQSWLYMRAADERNIPSEGFTRAALPPELHETLAIADEARRLQSDIKIARPEFRERAVRSMREHAFYDATGEPVGA